MPLKIFERQGHYFATDNEVIDTLMRDLTGMEFKLLFLIIRKTDGWGKESDAISYSQFAEYTGAGSHSSISNSLKSLEEKGLIIIEKSEKSRSPYIYRLNREATIPLESDIDENESISTESVVPCTTESVESPPKVVPCTTESVESPLQKVDTQKTYIKTNRNKEPKGSTARAPNPIYSTYLEFEQIQPGINRGQTLASIKRMSEKGHSFEEIISCGRWLNKDPWRIENFVPLSGNAVEKVIDRWKSNGMPAIHKKQSTNGQHKQTSFQYDQTAKAGRL